LAVLAVQTQLAYDLLIFTSSLSTISVFVSNVISTLFCSGFYEF
jgi:hypothetical protein